MKHSNLATVLPNLENLPGGAVPAVAKRPVRMPGLATLDWQYMGRKALLPRHSLLSVTLPQADSGPPPGSQLLAVGNNVV